MKTGLRRSLQDSATKSAILSKAVVKRDQLQVSGDCECGQIRVTPNICGQRRVLRQRSPNTLKSLRFIAKGDSFVSKDLQIQPPCILQIYSGILHHLGIAGQPEKSHLSDTRKQDAVHSCSIAPLFRRGMSPMRLEYKSQPKIDVRKIHSNSASQTRYLPPRESPKCVRWLVQCCQELTMAQEEIELDVYSWRRERSIPIAAQCSPKYPREGSSTLRLRSRHFVLCLGFPCLQLSHRFLRKSSELLNWSFRGIR